MPAAFEPGPSNPQPFSVGPQLQPHFDVIELLPPAGADRHRALRQRSSEAHKLIPPFEDIRELSMSRIDAENALKRLVSHPHDGGFHLPETDSRVVAATKHLEKMTADFERVKALSEVRSEEWRTKSAAKSNIETWLRDGRPHGTVLEDFDGHPEPQLLKGESITDGIERIRRRGRELKADLHRISSSPFPSSYCKQQARAQVERLAQRGAPSIGTLIEHDREIAWQMQRVQSQVYNTEVPAVAFAEVPDTLALLAWVHRDALIKRLDAEIDAEADDKSALDHAERKKRESEVLSDLLAVERDECALVWSAMEQKLPVEHRADCSPLAILQLRLVTAPRAGAPETSPGHAYDLVQPGRGRR